MSESPSHRPADPTPPAVPPTANAARDKTARSYVRRDDRAVNDPAWLRTFLERAPVGVLATVADGQPFVHTNLFVYDAGRHCLYLHTARTGHLRRTIEAGAAGTNDGDRPGAPVSFAVMEMGRLLPADEALEFSVEYAGVTVFGRAVVVDDDAEAIRALQWLLDKYAPHLVPGHDYRPPVSAELKRTSVYRIDIDEWSGKKKEAAPDFPGAYWYAAPPVLAALAHQPPPESPPESGA